MSKSARSVFVFGWYLGLLELTLVTVPNSLLGVFQLPATKEVWIRIVGTLVILLYFLLHTGGTQGDQGFFPMDSLCPLCSISIFYRLCPAEIRQSRADIVRRSGFSRSDLDKFCSTLGENLVMTFAGVVAWVESLQGRMGESTRQVEGLFESLLDISFKEN